MSLRLLVTVERPLLHLCCVGRHAKEWCPFVSSPQHLLCSQWCRRCQTIYHMAQT